jgi:hypothetical protein
MHNFCILLMAVDVKNNLSLSLSVFFFFFFFSSLAFWFVLNRCWKMLQCPKTNPINVGAQKYQSNSQIEDAQNLKIGSKKA